MRGGVPQKKLWEVTMIGRENAERYSKDDLTLENLREGVAPRPGAPGGRVPQKGDQDTQGNGRSGHSAAREEGAEQSG